MHIVCTQRVGHRAMLLRESFSFTRDLITLLSEGSVVLLGLKRTFDRSVGLPAVTLFLAPQLGSRSGLSL
jgi:hypothetical protein